MCTTLFDNDKLKNAFMEFWSAGSLEIRRNFVLRYCSHVEKRGKSKFLYSLPTKLGLEMTNRPVNVCFSFFSNVFDVTSGFIRWTLLKKDSDFSIRSLPDGRGGSRFVGPRAPLSDQQFEEIRSVLVGERVQPSHYGRRDSKTKLYFDSSKSIKYFYNKYTTAQAENQSKIVSYSSFRRCIRAAYPELSFKKLFSNSI